MIEAILQLLPCAAYRDGEDGIGGCFVGVPVVPGSGVGMWPESCGKALA